MITESFLLEENRASYQAAIEFVQENYNPDLRLRIKCVRANEPWRFLLATEKPAHWELADALDIKEVDHDHKRIVPDAGFILVDKNEILTAYGASITCIVNDPERARIFSNQLLAEWAQL